MKIVKLPSLATNRPHPLQALADAFLDLADGEALEISELGRDYFARPASYIQEQLLTLLPVGVSVTVESDGMRTPSAYTVTRGITIV